MEHLRKFCRLKANSILESVIALCIIAVCLYIAILVYAMAFTPKTTPKFYSIKNKVNEIYYLAQVNPDTIEQLINKNLSTKNEIIKENLQQVLVEYKDSSGVSSKNIFFIPYDKE